MDKYKPGYLGKMIPADDPSKVTEFVTKQYESFSAVYDSCKEHSDKISDVKPLDAGSGSSSLSVKVSTDKETMAKIEETASSDTSVTVKGDTITAKSSEPDKK